MAVDVKDPRGVEWRVRRKWWPFGDLFDWADDDVIGVVVLLIAAPFLLLWPVWLAAKFMGLQRWRIIVERAGERTGTELVRGWSASRGRMAELALEIGQGTRSGHFAL